MPLRLQVLMDRTLRSRIWRFRLRSRPAMDDMVWPPAPAADPIPLRRARGLSALKLEPQSASLPGMRDHRRVFDKFCVRVACWDRSASAVAPAP